MTSRERKREHTRNDIIEAILRKQSENFEIIIFNIYCKIYKMGENVTIKICDKAKKERTQKK